MAEAMIPDLLALHSLWPFELVVRDASEFAAVLVAEKLGIPHATAGYASFESPSNRQQVIGSVLDGYRSKLGLQPDPQMNALWRYLTVAPTAPSLVTDRDYVAQTTHFVRPTLFDQSGKEELPGWVAEPGDRPTIYATLGTTASRFDVALGIFESIVLALRDEPVNLVLTVGRGQNTERYDPHLPHIHVEQYVPQSLLFPHCDAVITHGGFNTTIAALSHGLPLIVIPIAADQFENAGRIEKAGAGVIIQPEDRSPETIRDASLLLLEDPKYRASARRVQQEIEALPGPDYAVRLLERLAAQKRPIILGREISW